MLLTIEVRKINLHYVSEKYLPRFQEKYNPQTSIFSLKWSYIDYYPLISNQINQNKVPGFISNKLELLRTLYGKTT